jgi:hypothetical protein
MALPAIVLAFTIAALGALTLLAQDLAQAGRGSSGSALEFMEADRVVKARLLHDIRTYVSQNLVGGALPAAVPSGGDQDVASPLPACSICADVVSIVFDNASAPAATFPPLLDVDDNATSEGGPDAHAIAVAQSESSELGQPAPDQSPVAASPRFHVHVIVTVRSPDGIVRTRDETLNVRIYNRPPWADIVGEDIDRRDPVTGGIAGDVSGQPPSSGVDTSAHAWLWCSSTSLCSGANALDTTIWQQLTGSAVGTPPRQWGE